MEQITFDLELVTPMFMGGADPTGPAEFRAASLKGLLRFWYRAIYPDRLQEEGRLFGTTEHRSPVTVRLQLAGNQEKYRLPKGSERLHEYAYLGYGLLKYNSQARKNLTERPCLTAGARATLRLSLVDYLTLDDKIKILRSIWALAMLGGLGARSRRGFGSFKVTSVDKVNDLPFTFSDRQSYFEVMQKILTGIVESGKSFLPDHTSFSPRSCVVVNPVASSPQEAWQQIGEQFQSYRNYKTNASAREDHDLMMNYMWHGTEPGSSPARAAFGLPHNYFFRKKVINSQERPELQGGVDLWQEGRAGRRASPLLIHIQKFDDGKASAVVSFFPAYITPITTDKKGRSVRQRLRISGVQQERENRKRKILLKQAPTSKKPQDFSMVEGFMAELVKNGAEVIL